MVVRKVLEELDVVRRFLTGQSTIDEVNTLSTYNSFVDFDKSGADETTLKAIEYLQRLIVLCCCQRELEANQLFYPTRYRPTAGNVASEICHVLVHVVGLTSASSADTRSKAQAAGNNEADWQLSHMERQVQDQ